jgi:hypothetical protein
LYSFLRLHEFFAVSLVSHWSLLLKDLQATEQEKPSALKRLKRTSSLLNPDSGKKYPIEYGSNPDRIRIHSNDIFHVKIHLFVTENRTRIRIRIGSAQGKKLDPIRIETNADLQHCQKDYQNYF